MSLVLVVALLASGGVVTSLAEYKFQYNLFDYIVEGIQKLRGVLTKEQLAFKAQESRIEAEVQRRVAQVKALEKKL